MSRHETKKYLKVLIITIFLIIIFGYSVYEVWNYATGPKITLHGPINGAAVAESLIAIEGQAKNVKKISLNDRPIVVNEVGNFSEKVLLSYGYNVLTLTAEDRFNQKTSQELQIIYK